MYRRRDDSKRALASTGHAREESGGVLTQRERQILQLIADGCSSKEVADRLQISVKTVDTHRSNLMRKLNFHSVSELVRYAIRIKLIEP
jgi:DNA-binding CsgD family transcriptional regulator